MVLSCGVEGVTFLRQKRFEYIQMLINCTPEGLRLCVMTEPILWGCAAELLLRLGLCPDDSFKKCFIETFPRLP